MTSFDDLDRKPAASESERAVPEPRSTERREVGPESEVRGGPEAPDQMLDEAMDRSLPDEDAVRPDNI